MYWYNHGLVFVAEDFVKGLVDVWGFDISGGAHRQRSPPEVLYTRRVFPVLTLNGVHIYAREKSFDRGTVWAL